jgi:2-phospho-L-lactate guanylyltransferase
MDCWAIIPVKPFRAGKSRLAGLLGADDRAALNRRLFGRVLTSTLAAFKPDRTVVVTSDPLLLPLMRGQDLHALDDSGDGLNAALGFACRHATARGAEAIAVLPSDLPRITPDDVGALIAGLKSAPCCVIGPDEQEEGTNALALAPPAPDFFRFGADSFQRHLEQARSRGMAVRILRRPGLAYDLDTPDEYRRYAKERAAGAMA